MTETKARYDHVLDSDGHVTCPFCLTEYHDDLGTLNATWNAFECDDCRKTFYVVPEYSVIYTSLVRVEDPSQ